MSQIIDIKKETQIILRMTKKTGFQLYKHLKAGHISLGTQASDQVGFLDD